MEKQILPKRTKYGKSRTEKYYFYDFIFNWRMIALQCKNILFETKKFNLQG